MAGDWIKMRGNLWDDPRVARICDITNKKEAEVIGGLYWLWSMADEQTQNGDLLGMSVQTVDRKTGVKGIGGALVEIGWLLEIAGGLTIARFDEHNGKSAKRRASHAKTMAEKYVPLSKRNNNSEQSLPFSDHECAEISQEIAEGGQLEKRRVYNTPVVPKGDEMGGADFGRFWASYPRKVGKGAAVRAWLKSRRIRPAIETILGALERCKLDEQWVKDDGQFIPHPATWLNEMRWADFDPVGIPEKQKIEGPDGWREIVAMSCPDYNCPATWGEVFPTIREGVMELVRNQKNSKQEGGAE